MNYNEINGLSSSSGILIDSTTVGSDGSFTYKVPSDADGVEVTAHIYFVQNQTQTSTPVTSVQKKAFYADYVFSSVIAGQTVVERIDLSESSQLDESTKSVTISGAITCNYNYYTSEKDKLPAGTQLTFRSSSTSGSGAWSKTVTVTTDGKYTVDVPKGSSVVVDYNFTLAGKLANNTSVTYRFHDQVYLSSYDFDTKDVDFEIYNDDIIE
jgi:hypothetical protein